MQMVGHNRVDQHIDSKNAGKQLQTPTNPLASMLEVLTGGRIESSQIGTSHAPLDAVHDRNFEWIIGFRSSNSRHFPIFQKEQSSKKTALPNQHRPV